MKNALPNLTSGESALNERIKYFDVDSYERVLSSVVQTLGAGTEVRFYGFKKEWILGITATAYRNGVMLNSFLTGFVERYDIESGLLEIEYGLIIFGTAKFTTHIVDETLFFDGAAWCGRGAVDFGSRNGRRGRS